MTIGSTSPGTFAVIAAVVCIAACLQGAIGFGLGMLSAPAVALLSPQLLPGTIVLLAGGMTVMTLIRDRTAVDFRGTAWALIGRVPGTVAGAALVALLPANGLAVLVAITVFIGVGLSLRGWQPRQHPVTLAAAGAASGLMGTATAIGGPPMAFVWQGADLARVRGTLSAFFLVGTVLSMIALSTVGALDPGTLTASALLAPVVVLGFAVSGFVNRYIDSRRARQVAQATSAVGAVLVLLEMI